MRCFGSVHGSELRVRTLRRDGSRSTSVRLSLVVLGFLGGVSTQTASSGEEYDGKARRLLVCPIGAERAVVRDATIATKVGCRFSILVLDTNA